MLAVGFVIVARMRIRRRFARAVGTEQTQDAWTDLEREIAQPPMLVVVLFAYVLDAHHHWSRLCNGECGSNLRCNLGSHFQFLSNPHGLLSMFLFSLLRFIRLFRIHRY